jgi:hypothetical protein
MSSTSRFNNNNNNNNNNNFKTNRFVSKHVNEERNKKQKEAEFIKSLDSLTSFPLLQTTPIKKPDSNNNNNNEKNQSTTFIEAMKTRHTNEKSSEKITTDDVVPPGHVCIKYDKISNHKLQLLLQVFQRSLLDDKPIASGVKCFVIFLFRNKLLRRCFEGEGIVKDFITLDWISEGKGVKNL